MRREEEMFKLAGAATFRFRSIRRGAALFAHAQYARRLMFMARKKAYSENGLSALGRIPFSAAIAMP